MTRLLVLTVLALWPAPAIAAGGEVVVVRSSELAPYKACEEAFTNGLGSPVKSVTLADAKGALGSAALVFAIGQDAAKLVFDAKPAGPVLYALVPAPEKLAPSETARAVPMFVSPQRQLQVVRELLPAAKRVGVIHGPTADALVAEYERAAKSTGHTLVPTRAKDRTSVAAALRELISKIDVLVLLPDPVTLGVDTFKFLLTTSLESKVPMIGFSQGQARAGAVLVVEADYAEMGREAATAAKRALAGSAPAPVAPTGSLYVNGKTLQVLGVTLPGGLKAQCKEIF